jgi:hypothetical protein
MRSAAWSYTDVRQNELERVCARGVKDELNLLLSETRTLRDTAHGSASDQDLSESGGQGLSACIKAQQPRMGLRTTAQILAIRIEVAVDHDPHLNRSCCASPRRAYSHQSNVYLKRHLHK